VCAGLILRRSGHVPINSQVGKEVFDFLDTHRVGVLLVMIQDEAFGPSDVGALGVQALAVRAQDALQATKEGRLQGHGKRLKAT